MIRGTTAQFKLKLPHPKNELEWMTIKFWQPNNPNELLPIIKRIEHCVTSNDNPNELYVSLTAEETSRFLDKYKAQMQFRAYHPATGKVFGNKTKLITVYSMPDDIIDADSTPDFPSENEDHIIVLDGQSIGVEREVTTNG